MHSAYGGQGLEDEDSGKMAQLQGRMGRNFQVMLDRSVPHIGRRWALFCVIVLIYLVRIYFLDGFYIVTYGLGIYNLNLIIGFLSPQTDPEADGPSLPTKGNEEYKPFVRRLPEFKFWYRSCKAFVTAFFMTFLSIFDVPVFWPILLMYWLMLFFMTMKQQIKHMIKHKYVPISWGKKQYGKGKGGGGAGGSGGANGGGASLDAASAPVKDNK